MMGNGSSSTADSLDPAPSAALALWAEDNDISAKDLAEAYGVGVKDTNVQGVSADSINGGLSKEVEVGKYIGMDCEMVGVGCEEDRSVLARVSIVNFHGTQVYDSFVRPKEFVTDWRTHVSGVSPKNMTTARSFEEVQKDVVELLKDRVLVGHAVKNDLEAMMLSHPKKNIRDTSRFSGFRKYSAGKTPSLKKLAKEILGVDIQAGEHSSIEDARATMLLFRRHKSAFDVEHTQRFPTHTANGTADKSKPRRKKKNKH
jgi:RNA exonuclease 4